MRQVSIKQLYSRLSAEMQDLPFEVTKNGVVVGTMLGPEGLDNPPKGLYIPSEKKRCYSSWSGGISKAKQVGKK